MTPLCDRWARASSSSAGRPDHESESTADLFVDGTLGLDDVMRRLTDRVPWHEETSTPGWRAARPPERSHRGLVSDPTVEAPGRPQTGLTVHELAVLDAFEDPTYAVTVVELRDGRHGLAYVWPEEALSRTWSTDSVDDDGLRAHLERCRRRQTGFLERQAEARR